MAQIIFTVPDEMLPLITEAYCSRYGYQPNVTADDGSGVPNPQTPGEFARQQVVNIIRAEVATYAAEKAAVAAKASTWEQMNAVPVTTELVVDTPGG